MLFLLNNPVIAVAFIISIGFSIVMIKKIVDEIKLNKGLQAKHLAMRVSKVNKRIVKRVSALGAASLAPVAVFAVALVIGLNVTPDTTNTDIVDIQSSADIMNIFEEFNEKIDNNYFGRGWFTTDLAMDGLEEMTPTNDAADFGDNLKADVGSDDHSEVNNQVEGVDEMDNVITDGLYIFSIYGNEVQVSKAWTLAQGSDALELLHTFTYNNNYGCDETSFYPMGLYEDEDNLIVVGNSTTYLCVDPEDVPEGKEPMYYDYWWGHNSYQQETKVIVYSKSDFEVEDEYAVKGNFIGTRKIGNDLYVVTSQYIPYNRYDTEAVLDVELYLPYYKVNDEQTIVAYSDIVYVDGTSPNAFTSFYAIDLVEKEIDMEVILGDSGYNLYVSNNNMYLVGNIYYFWPVASVLDVEEPVYEQKTAIMRVAITDSSVEFDGVGYVDGTIENQFSMDEYQGHLRVTTTVGWWGDVVNYLWVLNDDLKIVGQVGGRDLPENKTLGEPGERIRSTRFDGDYAYIVTFLQTDPFYVINLSDPENPFIEGSLKITGFSEHLQVLDDDHVLGIGFEADENGRQIGLKFNIYDVSDKANPVEAFENPTVFLFEEYGYAWTSAIWNHKDLLVNLDKGILSMPFSTHGWNETDDYWTYNSGILLFDLSIEEGIGEYDFIVHEENARFDCYVYKSLFIDDQFYTISNKYIKVAPLDDPTNFTNSITLREFEYQTNPEGDPIEVDPDVVED